MSRSTLCAGAAHIWCLSSRNFHPDCDCLCHDESFREVAAEIAGLSAVPKHKLVLAATFDGRS